MRSRRVAQLAQAALAFALAASSAACDRIPGLGKKDADGGASGSGGVLSFLGGTFEGEITMLVSGRAAGGPAKPLVFGIKSPKVRIDAASGVGGNDNPMLGAGGAFIIDPPAKKAYALMPAQKQALVIDFDKAKAMRNGGGLPGLPGSGSSGAAANDPPKVEKTGKKEVVAGYECEDWKITSKTGRADMCVADGIKWIDLTDLGMASPEMGFAAAATEANHFPLRVIAYDEKNVETTRMEATKIEKKKLDDARFVVPPDFKVIDMSALLGGLQIPAGGKPPPIPLTTPPKR